MRRRLPPALRLALTAYAERLRPIFGERLLELRLFGSFARGEAHEDSDVDVLVVVEGLTDLEIGVVAGEAAPIIQQSGLALAPLPMSSARLATLRQQRVGLATSLDRDGIAL